jgi:hypothetical protein
MSRIIGRGRYASETYPEAPRSAIVNASATYLEIATDHPNSAPDAPAWVEISAGVPLELSFASWSPGDVLCIDVYSRGVPNSDIGPLLAWQITPKVNVGSGWQAIFPGSGVQTIASSTALSAASLSSFTSVQLDSPPTVRLEIVTALSSENPQITLPISLRLVRVPASEWQSPPNNVLV